MKASSSVTVLVHEKSLAVQDDNIGAEIASITARAPGEDTVIGTRKLLLRANAQDSTANRVILLMNDPAVHVETGASADPTITGGSLEIAVAGDRRVYPLPPAHWSSLRNGFRYDDPDGIDGPVRKVKLIDGKKIKLKGRGSSLDFDLSQDPNPVSVVLAVGGRRYSMSAGGEAEFDAGVKYLARNAPPPAGCQ